MGGSRRSGYRPRLKVPQQLDGSSTPLLKERFPVRLRAGAFGKRDAVWKRPNQRYLHYRALFKGFVGSTPTRVSFTQSV